MSLYTAMILEYQWYIYEYKNEEDGMTPTGKQKHSENNLSQ